VWRVPGPGVTGGAWAVPASGRTFATSKGGLRCTAGRTGRDWAIIIRVGRRAGRGAEQGLRRQDAAGAGAVLDEDGLIEGFVERGGEDAGDQIGHGGGREADE
jgi:hypothetical protein